MSKEIAVFYNLKSGRGSQSSRISKLTQVLLSEGYEPVFYNYIDEANNIEVILSELKKNFIKRIILAGGDGTFHYFINDLIKYNFNEFFELSLYPLGTSNDFASFFKFKRNNKKFINQLKYYDKKTIDTYKINDTYFIYAAAIGKFSLASYNVKRKTIKLIGFLGYVLAALKDLFKVHKRKYELITEDEKYEGIANLIVFAGINRIASVKFSKKLGIKPNDGLINAFIFKRKSIFSWLNIIWFYLFSGRVKIGIESVVFKTATLKLKPNSKWNVDGEGASFNNPFKITTIPNSIIVNIPNNKLKP